MRKFASESPRGGNTVDDLKKFTPLLDEEEEKESDLVPVDEISNPATVEEEGDESEGEIYKSEVADDVRQAQKELMAKRETTAELGKLLKLKQGVKAIRPVRETIGSKRSVLAEMGAYELDKDKRSGHRGTHKPLHKDVRQSIEK